jgi:hypothetical protein
VENNARDVGQHIDLQNIIGEYQFAQSRFMCRLDGHLVPFWK